VSKNIKILLLMCAGLFLATGSLYLLLQVQVVSAFNTELLLWINQFYWPPLAQLTAFLEQPDALFFGILIVLILAYFDRPDLALCVLIAVVISSLYVMVAKELIALPRPFVVITDLQVAYFPSGYSFPSGHTAGAFAAFSAWCFRERRHYLPLLGFATIIGISRVYIGVHYPMDVLAGAVVGLIMGYAVAQLDLTVLMRKLAELHRRTRVRLGRGRAKA
jgi:undecaprenyl-diphosphatase